MERDPDTPNDDPDRVKKDPPIVLAVEGLTPEMTGALYEKVTALVEVKPVKVCVTTTGKLMPTPAGRVHATDVGE